jgi:DDE family transposase
MGIHGNLHHWFRQLLPAAGKCAQHAAVLLLQSMLTGYTAQLAQIARQADGEGDTATQVRYQLFRRWLKRPHWDAETLYAHLCRRARRVLAHRRHVPLLMDITDLGTGWAVLQVSFPWQGRALPLYRVVTRYEQPEVKRREVVRGALAFLRQHLPGSRGRYLLVADRGFPGHWLVKDLQEGGWRFVLRIDDTWKVKHVTYTGLLGDAPKQKKRKLVGTCPRLLIAGEFGRRPKGRDEWCVANLVLYHGTGHKEPWYLITSEAGAAFAVAIYRQRMKIECEFRDLKGPFGLDRLERWHYRERVARFLAMVAVYEWRLAYLWIRHHLRRFGASLTKYGKLSWIRITRELIQRQIRLAAKTVIVRL